MSLKLQPTSTGNQTVTHELITKADLKSAPLTVANASAPAVTYGAAEQAVLVNLQARVNQLEARLTALGMLAN